LNRTVGIADFAPLKPYFMTLIQATRLSLNCHSSTPALLVPMSHKQKPMPKPVFPLSNTIQLLQAAYKSTKEGKFAEALDQFTKILYLVLFTSVDSREELNEVFHMIEVNYFS
jgi:coatomer subunit alpha